MTYASEPEGTPTGKQLRASAGLRGPGAGRKRARLALPCHGLYGL